MGCSKRAAICKSPSGQTCFTQAHTFLPRVNKHLETAAFLRGGELVQPLQTHLKEALVKRSRLVD